MFLHNNSLLRHQANARLRLPRTTPFLRAGLLLGLTLLAGIAQAQDWTPVRLRIGGKDIRPKTAPVTDGKTFYAPLTILATLGLRGEVNAKEDHVRLRGRNLEHRTEIPLTRINNSPMLSLNALADAIDADVVELPAPEKPKNPAKTGSKADEAKPTAALKIVGLLAHIKEARFEDGKVKIITSFPVPYHVRTLTLTPPLRGYVDCVGAVIGKEMKVVKLADDETRVVRLRAGNFTDEIGRVVLEFNEGSMLKEAVSPSNSNTLIIAGVENVPVRVARANQNGTGREKPGTGTTQKPSSPDDKSAMREARNPMTPPTVQITENSEPNPLQPDETKPDAASANGQPMVPIAKPKPRPNPVELFGLTFEPQSDTLAKLQITTGGRTQPIVRYLPGGMQMQIDLPNTFVPQETDALTTEQKFTHPLITALRTEQFPGDRPFVRVVVDVSRVLGYSVDSRANGVTVAFRLPRNANGALADKLIVIDPGHGGNSPGAGGGGYLEKNICLSVCLKLRDALESLGARVVMTRDTDSSVKLEARPQMANDIGADLFVSVHNNSSPRPGSASGTETYYHSGDPSSRALAFCVQQAVASVTGLPSRGALSDGVLYASGLAVLRLSQMPAILCEVAYINHSTDRSKLVDSGFQSRVAQAIGRGIRHYVEGRPQPDRQPPPKETNGETVPPAGNDGDGEN